MHKLIVIAHPNPDGFSHHIAKRFAAISLKKGHKVRSIHLYDPTMKQDFLQLDGKNKPAHDPHVAYMQEQIIWADQLIFVYPIWWYDAPAILKNWFDVNMSSGFAYKYKKHSLLPRQYLRGKSARFFVTAGSPAWLRYTPIGRGIFINMVIGRLGFVGIWTKSFTVFGSMKKHRDIKYRKKFLAKAERIAKR